MKEINSSLFLEIVNDMTCIHNQLMQKEYFCAGSNFNRLQQVLVGLFKQLKREEDGGYGEDEEQEEIQEQDECSSECEEEKAEIQDELDNMKREYILHQKRIVALEEFIKLLLKNDHIYKPSIESTLNILRRENETMEDMKRFLPGFPMRPAY